MDQQRKVDDEDRKQQLMNEFGVYHPTDEEWDAQTRAFEEDAKKPITERTITNLNVGFSAMFENHFNEELEAALINSNEKEFLALLKASCLGFKTGTEGFDLLLYLQDTHKRVSQYVADKININSSLRRSLYIQTGKAITDGIEGLLENFRITHSANNHNQENILVTPTLTNLHQWEVQQKKTLKDNGKLETDRETKSSKATEIRHFPTLLIGNYSEKDLNKLLVYLRMRNEKLENIWPIKKKSALYGVIDALSHKGYLIESTIKERIISLTAYLGLAKGRAKNGYSEIQKETEKKALFFLNQLVMSKK